MDVLLYIKVGDARKKDSVLVDSLKTLTTAFDRGKYICTTYLLIGTCFNKHSSSRAKETGFELARITFLAINTPSQGAGFP